MEFCLLILQLQFVMIGIIKILIHGWVQLIILMIGPHGLVQKMTHFKIILLEIIIVEISSFVFLNFGLCYFRSRDECI